MEANVRVGGPSMMIEIFSSLIEIPIYGSQRYRTKFISKIYSN